jgi:hypothetical protein
MINNNKIDLTKKYNINTKVNLYSQELGLVYNPTKMESISSFNKLLNEMAIVANEIQRVITHIPFNQFIQGFISDGGGKFKEMKDESFRCRNARETISQKIDSDFKAPQADFSKIENCRDVHEFTQKNFEKDLKP